MPQPILATHSKSLLSAPFLRELGGGRDWMGSSFGDGSPLKEQSPMSNQDLAHLVEPDSYQRPITGFPVGKESMKEVGQIEQSRNVKTDALNHLPWFLPTAQHRCRAISVSVTSSTNPA